MRSSSCLVRRSCSISRQASLNSWAASNRWSVTLPVPGGLRGVAVGASGDSFSMPITLEPPGRPAPPPDPRPLLFLWLVPRSRSEDVRDEHLGSVLVGRVGGGEELGHGAFLDDG